MNADTRFPLDGAVSPRHLAAIASLPSKPVATALAGRFVALEPFDAEAHGDALWDALGGGAFLGHDAYDAEQLVWRYLWGAPADRAALVARVAARAAMADSCSWVLRLLRGPHAGAIVGTFSLMANRPADLVVEIGMVIAAPAMQGSPVVTDATVALLRHCFALGYRRVEWKTNALNARSRASALRNGFVFEGVFRRHMVVQGGASRDTAWYSMIEEDFEGPAALAAEAWLDSFSAMAMIERG